VLGAGSDVAVQKVLGITKVVVVAGVMGFGTCGVAMKLNAELTKSNIVRGDMVEVEEVGKGRRELQELQAYLYDFGVRSSLGMN
jgi:hypothetical protein